MISQSDLLFPALVTLLAVLVYFVLVINVGRARAKYSISPPAVTGNEDFERVLRVQLNTLEQMVIFLPSLWVFVIYVQPLVAGIIGTVWVLGRILFAWGYYQAAEKRTLGFALSSLSSLSLMLGSLGAIVWQLWQTYGV